MASILTTAGSSTSSGTTGSFTPNADRLLLALVMIGGNGTYTVSGITGHDGGASWEKLDDDAGTTQPTLYFEFEIWACITGSSPSASTVVATATGEPTSSVLVMEAAADFSGTTVANSVIQTAAMKEYNGPVLDITPVLSAFGDASNATVAFGYSNGSGTVTTLSATGGLTEDFTLGSFVSGFWAGSQDSNDTTPIIDDTDTYTCKGGFALEIAFQSSGASVTDVNLVSLLGAPRASLSSLKWSWFDVITPATFVAPIDQGTAEATDGSGNITLSLTNSVLTSGQEGLLVLRDSANSYIGAYRLAVD